MKKLFTLALALGCATSLFAESMQVLTLGLGLPGRHEPQLYGLGMSPDGRFVCGAIEMGAGIFIANLNEKEDVIFTTDVGQDGGELRHINDQGLAVGITELGITYDYTTEKITEIPFGEMYRSSLCEDLTDDGSMIVGSLVADFGITHAAYKKGDADWVLLPVPTGDELGGVPVRAQGSAAKYVSGDGKVIYGCVGSFTVPIVWTLNDQGEYEYDFFPARLLKLTEADLEDTERPLFGMTAMYGMNISNNGKYVTALGSVMYPGQNNPDMLMNIPIVYNTETKEATVYSEKQPVDLGGNGLYPCAIDDSGTFIGTIGMPFYGSIGSFIWEAGAENATEYSEVFPVFERKFGEANDLGFDVPTAMSKDGRYLLGYTYYSENYYDDSPAYYVTYVIDRNGVDAINEVSVDGMAKPEAIYNIDGIRMNGMAKGLNIIRMSDGSVKKVFKK